MILEAIATVIVEQGLGVLGSTLFLHHMPETCQQGVLLRLSLEGVETDNYKPGFYKTWYQVIVRDTTYASGEAKAQALFSGLEFYNRSFTDTLGRPTIKILQSYNRNLPVPFPRSPDNLLEWSIRFDLQFVQL